MFNSLKKFTKIAICFNVIALGASSVSAEGLTHDVWKMTGAYGKQVIQTINSNNLYPFVSSTGTEADEGTPKYSDTISNFDITLPSDIWFSGYHGERAHGYLIPRVTGIHKFFVSGNKDVELYINYDENGNGSPTNERVYGELTKVAEMLEGDESWYSSTDYDWYRSDQAPLKDVMLNAGQVYYIAALTKSVCCRTPDNKFQVAWQEPTGGIQTAAPVSGDGANVIPSDVLTEFVVVSDAPEIILNSARPLYHEVGVGYQDPATCTDDVDASCSVSVTDWGGMNQSNPQLGAYTLTLTTGADSTGNVTTKTRTVNVFDSAVSLDELKYTTSTFGGEHFLASTKSATTRQSGYLGSSAYQGPRDMYSVATKDPLVENTDSFFLSYESFYTPTELNTTSDGWNRLYSVDPDYDYAYADHIQYGLVSRFSKQGDDDFQKEETISFKDQCESIHGMTASENGKLVAILCRGYPSPDKLKSAVSNPFSGYNFTDLTPTGKAFTDGPHLASMYILEYHNGRVTDNPDQVIRISKAAGGANYGNNEIDYVCNTEGGCTCGGTGNCEGGSYFVHIKVQSNDPDNRHENLYKYIVNRPADIASGSFNRQYARESCGSGHPEQYRKTYNSHQKAWAQTCYLDACENEDSCHAAYINTLPADALGTDQTNYTHTLMNTFKAGNTLTTSGNSFSLLSLGEDGYMTLLSGPGDTLYESPKVGFYFHRLAESGAADELKWTIGADEMLALGITDVGRFGYVKAAAIGHADSSTIEESERFLVGFSPNIDPNGEKAKPEVFVVGEFDREGELIGNMVELNEVAWSENNNWSTLPSTGCVAFAFGSRAGEVDNTNYPVQTLMKASDLIGTEEETLQDSGFTKDIQLTTVCSGNTTYPQQTGLASQLGVLDLTANDGINPATGEAWKAGDQYRLTFISSESTQATDTDIASYNTFVSNLAAAAGYGRVDWRVIGSTAAVDARDNTSTNPSVDGDGTAIFLMDGSSKIANNNSDLWDTTIDTHIALDENGNTKTGAVFTGTNGDGTSRSSNGRVLGGSTETPSKVVIGNSATTILLRRWVIQYNKAAADSFPVYALSEPLTIIDTTATETNLTFSNSDDFLGWSLVGTGDANGDTYFGGFGNGTGTGKSQSGPDTYKFFTAPDHSSVANITFDFIAVDTWDNEHFYLYIDDQEVDLGTFHSGTATTGQGVTGDVTWSIAGGDEINPNIGFTRGADRRYTITATAAVTPGVNFELGFGSNLNSAADSDESWGIDNLTISYTN